MNTVLDLRGHTPRRRGELQGEAWRDAAAELVDGRVTALCGQPRWADEDRRRSEGAALLEIARERSEELCAELEGVAHAIDRPAWTVAVAGAFHDLWDRGGNEVPSGNGERTTLYVVGAAPVMGQALLAADERAALRCMRVDGPAHAPRGDHDDDEGVAVVTLAGTLGLGGVRRGFVVAANHLRSRSAGRGTFEGVEVREALLAADAHAARERLDRRARGGGRFYLVSDGEALFGLESDGPTLVLTRKGARTAHTHTDHFFDPVLRRHELRSDEASTYRRTELSTSVYVQRRPTQPHQVWDFLSELDELRGASGDEARDRSTVNLFGRSALWVGCAARGGVWIRTGLERDDCAQAPPAPPDADDQAR